jgi:CCR4-NOT transcription complex subunit 1
MDQKAVELLECTGEEYLPWVAQYLVMKRASIEHNFHTLYSNFIDHLKKPEVLSAVIAETYRNIRVLLRCDKGVANYSDRTLLKNLGHWLGLLTLARNKPIFFREMDVKGLIYESYHKGAQELLYVIPFVAKILESCAKSRVFKPPNPWTMAMMNVLAELHREPDMKLNLKFEIEVLCKNLQIDINDLIPSQYLKDTSLLERLEPQLSAPSRPAKDGSTPQPDEPLQICMPIPSVAMGAGVMMSSSVGAMMAPPPAPPPTATVLPPVAQHPQPQFAYHDISGLTLTALMSHAVINEQIALFHAHPQLKTCVKPAIERAIQEMLPPAIERATKIAVTTSEMIVKKDFALDPDESRMRVGAHHLVRFMTAGMALITCHEPVLISINGQLKTAFITALGGASATQKELIEHAAQVLAQDNAELATAFLQKAAVEKAIPEIDKHLNNDYELRKHARSEGRRYCDPQVLTYQAERMPEQIRLKVGGVTPQQIAVYEEFSRCIPGFQPVGGSNMNTSGPELVTSTAMDIGVNNPNHPPTAPYVVKPLQSMIGGPEDIFQIYDKVYRDIEQHLSAFQAAAPNLPQTVAIRSLLEFVLHARQSVRDPNPAMALVQRAVEGLLDGFTVPPTGPEQEMMLRYRDCHLLVLRALQDQRVYGSQWTNKHVTRCLISCHEDYRYNIEAVDLLIHGQFVVMPQYDLHLTHSMESGMNYQAVVFAMTLVQRFCTDIDKLTVRAQEGDFCNTIEALSRIAIQSRQPPEGLATLLESLRQNTEGSLTDRVGIAPPPMMLSGIIQARELDDPPGLHEKTEYLLREWVGLYHMPAAGIDSGKAFQAFVAQMHMHGILKTDDLITRFFRLCTEMCVDLCYRVLSEPSQAMARVRVQCFHTLDAFVRLIQLLLRHSGDTSNTNTKINLLNKVLGIVAGVLLQDHDVRHTEFQQLPYHRIFIMLFIELNAPEQVLESINFDVLQAFCNVLHILRPVKAPGFAYAWLELVSHRLFIGRVLALTPNQRAWGMYATLLIDLFKFLAPFLRNAELTKPAQLLYKGTMRVLLVLLHDFPEFLCDYHYAFCDVIPPNCIQVRNLVLSAFPRNMRLPDPFTPNLKVDMLPDIALAPRIMSNFVNFIQPQSFRKEIDTYLKTRAPVTFVSELRSKLQVSSSPGMKYNIALMNALVMYVGTQAIQYIHSKSLTPSMATIAHSSHMDIFQNLAVDMDTEGRYLFLNAVANQLRYPNSHTHYFSCTLLYLFAEANSEAIQEQITRVLLERLIVNRPHPWGLLITFIELIKNPQFKFWNHEFVHCAPEIEKLLDSVARSCMQSKPREPDVTDVR